ncbi:MAG: NTP transferase domain-containing protein, partial [Bacteroidales bacterium]|nr:NTP transferase domain-containing protein [Bacteroidales bacterium]
MNHVVIMAGGIGSRFWPLSTPDFPKQFIDILGCGRTLIQLTVDRFKGVCADTNFWVVTNQKYVDIVKEQIPAIPSNHILAEPAARNTAPCVAWASWCIRQEDPDANIVVTPSDAVVMNPMEFQRVIKNALNFTSSRNAIVTIGIKPNRPEVGYGYVQYNVDVDVDDNADVDVNVDADDDDDVNVDVDVDDDDNVDVDADADSEIKNVGQFKEKPNLETAQQYLAAGNYLWNAGIFVFN